MPRQAGPPMTTYAASIEPSGDHCAPQETSARGNGSQRAPVARSTTLIRLPTAVIGVWCASYSSALPSP